MKKLFIIFLAFMLSINISNAQRLVFNNTNYNTWVLAETGPGSFYIDAATDYLLKPDGFYYFTIYFFSNATNQYGYLTSAYVENVNVFIQTFDPEKESMAWKKVFQVPYVLVQPKSVVHNGINNVAYVYSTNMYQKIKITWTSSNPY